ncbi:Ger(x)C family spore germination protein [Alkalihalobacillus sp. AL-G]|uniref:Ger(x)C family spore germination protein n=1 Tax=Alkalihalobacillus sp. AL-G TaxID=2926399 RepID=UPI00272D538D|nr:Ger(x)C family spore germination protein [Alkalihalobacillus sp. AL-G]WLD91642.1 Ger(x)C family spore germination protein [Alkalihalobacillus sp. AL-G]
MRTKVVRIIMFFGSLIMLTSCVPNYSVEDAAMISAAGYDYVEEDKIKGTVSIPQFGRQETGGTMQEKKLTASANTVREVHARLQSKSSKPLVIGKLSVSMYSEELARKDLADVIDNLGRDARIGRNIFLVIVDGSTEQFLQKRYSQTETTAKYLTGIIKHNNESNFPTTNLHEYLYAYYAEGMDGFLPIMKTAKDHAKITGIAFFKKGRLVYTIPYSKSFNFKIMNENFSQGIQDIEFKDRHVVMENIGSTVKYHVKGNHQTPKFLIDIHLTGIINEVSSLKKQQGPKVVKKMEKAFEQFYKEQCSLMVKEFQEYNVDPLGLGNVLKSRIRNFDNKKWKQQYPNAQIDVKVNVEIVETGISS